MDAPQACNEVPVVLNTSDEPRRVCPFMVKRPYLGEVPVPDRTFVAVGSALANLRSLPREVQRAFGGALALAQEGVRPEGSVRFGEGLPRDILKFSERHAGETYRMAYVAAFPDRIYLLHAFQKKSPSGRRTSRVDRDRIRERFMLVRRHQEAHERQ